MEVSALKYSGGIGLHARSPLLRLQSDERLVALVRRGNTSAFEVLVSRYESRLQAFCRHLLGSREDAEDVLQEVLAAAFNAMLADERPINVKPWLYRIARNRSLNHLRRVKAIGVDSMDVHLSEHGLSTAEKVHEREEFRLLVGDIHDLPETQKTALVLREMDALSYEQIAEAMETTVPSVKSLLVRARVSLAEAAEARLLSCDEVRIELGELAEGLRRKPSPLVRRHLKSCNRCSAFRDQLKDTNKALAAIMPIGPLVVLKKLVLGHVGHSAGSSATASSGAGAGAAAGGTAIAGSAGGFVSAGVGAIATKAAAGLAAAVLVTGAAVEVTHTSRRHVHHAAALASATPATVPVIPATVVKHVIGDNGRLLGGRAIPNHLRPAHKSATHTTTTTSSTTSSTASSLSSTASSTSSGTTTLAQAPPAAASQPGRTQVQTDPTILAPAPPPTVTTTATPTPTDSTGPVSPAPPPTTTTSTSATTESPGTTTGSTSSAAPPAPASGPAADTGSSTSTGDIAQP
jgi:RNA polymerase sigma factor (sigma-70 family)